MKKLFSIVVTGLLMFIFALSSFAAIKSTNDINKKINGLTQLSTYDYNKFVNKSDLIGYRRQNFEMATAQYQNSAAVALENLKRISIQVQSLNSEKNISSAEKTVQISKLYQEAESSLSELDSKSLQYLSSAKSIMPPITYQRFAKKFKTFYNTANVTNSKFKLD